MSRFAQQPTHRNIGWIAVELLRIRMLECSLLGKLQSSTPLSGQSLLTRLEDLNLRLDLLERVLDN